MEEALAVRGGGAGGGAAQAQRLVPEVLKCITLCYCTVLAGGVRWRWWTTVSAAVRSITRSRIRKLKTRQYSAARYDPVFRVL